MSQVVLTKICNTCKEEKPLTKEFFFIRSSSKTGFCATCKTCYSKNVQNSMTPENRELKRERDREYLRNKKAVLTPEEMEQKRERDREYRRSVRAKDIEASSS